MKTVFALAALAVAAVSRPAYAAGKCAAGRNRNGSRSPRSKSQLQTEGFTVKQIKNRERLLRSLPPPTRTASASTWPTTRRRSRSSTTPKPARTDRVAATPGDVEAMVIRVWDPLVRVFHWTLVVSFVVCWLSAQVWEDLHAWAGYVAGALALGARRLGLRRRRLRALRSVRARAARRPRLSRRDRSRRGGAFRRP